MKEAWGWIRDIAIAVVIAAVLLFFFKPIIIQQESMQPNFYSKDYVIVSKQASGDRTKTNKRPATVIGIMLGL